MTTFALYTVHVAVNRPDAKMSARYDYVRAADAQAAVSAALQAAYDETGVDGWELDAVEEVKA